MPPFRPARRADRRANGRTDGRTGGDERAGRTDGHTRQTGRASERGNQACRTDRPAQSQKLPKHPVPQVHSVPERGLLNQFQVHPLAQPAEEGNPGSKQDRHHVQLDLIHCAKLQALP